MKAVILARVSTKEQEEQGHSLPAQIRRLRDYAQKKEFEIVQEFSFSESAGRKIRKKFEEVLKYLKTHKDVNVLLCENVDRVTRNFKDAVDIDDMRRNAGLEVHFVQDGFFINAQATGNQMFMWEAKVFLAKQYLNRLTDDVKRTIEEKLGKGQWPGRATIGYLNIDTTDGHKDIIPDSAKRLMVVKAFELYATGNYSMKRLVEILTEDGLTNGKTGKPITKSQLGQIFKNPFYYGVMRYDGQLYPHSYEPLISKWLYDKCQEIGQSRFQKGIKYASKPFIFRGLIHCASCGCLVGKDSKKGINYCICNQYKGKHGAQRVREEELVEQVSKAFEEIRITEQLAEEIKEKIKKVCESEQQFYKTSLEQDRKEFDRLENMLKEAYYDKIQGKISPEFYNEIFADLDQRKEKIKDRMARHYDANKEFFISSSLVLDLANRAAGIFKSSEDSRKREIINFALKNLRLEGKKLIWDYKKPFDAIVGLSNNSSWLPELDSNQQPLR